MQGGVWVESSPDTSTVVDGRQTSLSGLLTGMSGLLTNMSGLLITISRHLTRAHAYDSETKKHVTLVTLLPMRDVTMLHQTKSALGRRGRRVT